MRAQTTVRWGPHLSVRIVLALGVLVGLLAMHALTSPHAVPSMAHTSNVAVTAGGGGSGGAMLGVTAGLSTATASEASDRADRASSRIRFAGTVGPAVAICLALLVSAVLLLIARQRSMWRLSQVLTRLRFPASARSSSRSLCPSLTRLCVSRT